MRYSKFFWRLLHVACARLLVSKSLIMPLLKTTKLLFQDKKLTFIYFAFFFFLLSDNKSIKMLLLLTWLFPLLSPFYTGDFCRAIRCNFGALWVASSSDIVDIATIKLQVVYSRNFEAATKSATKIASSCATKTTCVNGALGPVEKIKTGLWTGLWTIFI